MYTSTIHIPDEDKEKIKDALARVSARAIEGYNWADEQMADIAKKYAANPGSADNVAGMAAQMPMAFAFGQMLSNAARPMAEGVFSLFGPGNSKFWPSYMFTVLALVIGTGVIGFCVSKKNLTLRDTFLNWPMVYVSCGYAAIQIIASFIVLSADGISPTAASSGGDVSVLCEEITLLLDDRNSKCKFLK